MKVLIIHNHYRSYGGEDAVVEAEKNLLKKYGHEVIYYSQSNAEIDKYCFTKKISTFLGSHWSKDSYLSIKRLIISKKPDVAHIHNTFLLITPAVYFACNDLNIPVVQTLHNYRFLCPSGKFYIRGKICEHCLKSRNFNKSIFYGCWRGSRLLTANIVRTLRFHEQRNTFSSLIDCYIALTEFSKNKFIEAGYPSDKIVVKPNFTYFASDKKREAGAGKYALFVGRLSEEKGVRFLINCWKRVNHIPLKIIGSGELTGELKRYSRREGLNIEFLGEKENSEVMKYIRNSAFIVFPSEWYETFGMVIIESFSCGIPVIASRIGAMPELVSDKKTGLLFRMGDPDDLLKQVNYLWDNVELTKEMGRNAKEEYMHKYTGEGNYEKLIGVYAKAIESKRLSKG